MSARHSAGVMMLFAAFALAMPQGARASPAYLWSKRPLLVFAASAADPRLVEQQRLLAAARPGLADRDIVVVWVVGESVQAELGPAPGRTAAALRSAYGASASGFRAILVGKDGGVKVAQGEPFSTTALFATIDAMPMRRDEVRGR